ncbi:MAG: hypothetical protein CL610_19150 [Anaerolineaceae bacterium]|nr:hypothetical protein [Anaerolineaceae bacterium]
MMKTRFMKFMQRSLRRSQSGQSIVILALGFVALLGFVGIVTDVSLMFVRYSTLTRAVDAASIAAAGQVRRQIPFQAEINEHCVGLNPDTGQNWTVNSPCPEAEAAAFSRSFGNIGVAARQFIEFYGLDPQAVLIDMCYTVRNKDDDGNWVALNEDVEDEFQELCVGPEGRNADRKLIKVTANIESQTAFLHLLGFSSFPLEASSISETAVLDVVLIMDVSESMLNQTTYDTWAREGYTDVYMPPDIWHAAYNTGNDGNYNLYPTGFGTARNHYFGDITGFEDYAANPPYVATGTRKWYYFRNDLAQLSPDDANSKLCIGQAECLTDNKGTPDPSDDLYSPFQIQVRPHPTITVDPEDKKVVRRECQVAYYPYAWSSTVPQDLLTFYEEAGFNGGDGWTNTKGGMDAFVPTYNFYRCCNDPDGDGDFSDLLCQPFRQARDATELFLQRIDFLRGDRVSFVTFDKQAFLVTVEVDETTDTYSHMIDNERLALDTLRQYIGVRAEPSFYEPNSIPDPDNAGQEIPVLPWKYQRDPDTNPFARSTLLGDHDYEVIGNCPYQDAAYEWPYSPSTSPSPEQSTDFVLPFDEYAYPNPLAPTVFEGNQLMYPRNDDTGNWENAADYGATRSYDLWASCRGTNIGAALRAGSNALVNPRTTRINGAVWVMVLLGDGAAGASDPVFDSSPSNPGGPQTEPADLYYPYNGDPTQVRYGGHGLCPIGTLANRSELTQFTESPYIFPFCSDELPETRSFCFDPRPTLTVGGESITPYVDLGYNCDRERYDVDDYARDWADWIGLSEPVWATDGQRSQSQLPTIFTIGFGLNFNDETLKCKQPSIQEGDVADCLGEELLRYIADVGDNFRIDTDYQQVWITTNQAGFYGDMTDEDFGPRGECEEPLAPGTSPSATAWGALINPKDTKVNCGNYYNAPSGPELNRVFDDIASRMFTRLTQ